VQPSPPKTEAPRRVTKWEVGVQNSAIDAVVATVEEIAVVCAELVRGHEPRVVDHSPGLQLPVGPFFRRQAAEKT
jgi:hypothetical protein